MASLPALLSWQDTPSEVARRLPLAFQFMNFQVLFFSLILVDAMIDTYLGLVWEYTVHGFGYLDFDHDPRVGVLTMIARRMPDVLRLCVVLDCKRMEADVLGWRYPIHEALIIDSPGAIRGTWKLMARLGKNIESLRILPRIRGQNAQGRQDEICQLFQSFKSLWKSLVHCYLAEHNLNIN
ncbi:hypothetical protein BD769DRAFT_1384451 [Suillus cothurnatus]|nr:hypothetical protein BD769DRAFT_1384451 [Suillus cothurnatus]